MRMKCDEIEMNQRGGKEIDIRESARISNPNPPAQIPTPTKSLIPSAGCAALGIVFTRIAGRETKVIQVAWPSLCVSFKPRG